MSDWIPYSEAMSRAAGQHGNEGAAYLISLLADRALEARAYRLKETSLTFGPDDFEDCQQALESDDLLDKFFPPFGGKGEIGTISDSVPFGGHHVLMLRRAKDGEWVRTHPPREKWRQELHLDLKINALRVRTLLFSENYGLDGLSSAYLWSAADWFGLEVEQEGFEKLLSVPMAAIEMSPPTERLASRRGGRRGAQHGEAIARATVRLAGLSPLELKRYTAQSLAIELAELYRGAGEQPPSEENLERYAQGILRVIRG